MLFLLTAEQAPLSQSDGMAYFKFYCPPNPETFIFQLNDPALISQARSMLAGLRPSLHIMGKVVRQPAVYNRPWSYHLEPNSIQFFHSAVELCDETIVSVEQHLDEVCGNFLPGCTWCPWSSRLVEEVGPPVETIPRLYLPLVVR